MIHSGQFIRTLDSHGLDFFTGVPDSVLSGLTSYLTESVPDDRHVIAANEGGAVALAVGHYLATGRPALVYMQNSGQGNAVNPLMSLASPDVYGIPMLLLIGWRGEPGRPDAPQHTAQGRATLPLLDVLGLPHRVLPDDEQGAEQAVAEMLAVAVERQTPVALVVREGTFGPGEQHPSSLDDLTLTREEALKTIAGRLDARTVVVVTTGKASREIHAYRREQRQSSRPDFLTIGGMGHASSVALGIALAGPARRVVCLDGDGAALMHLGAMAIIGSRKPSNLTHVIINNGAHDSVGGAPTVGFAVSLPDMALACGYRGALSVDTRIPLAAAIEVLRYRRGPVLVEVRVCTGSRPDLPRPAESPQEGKRQLMELLKA